MLTYCKRPKPHESYEIIQMNLIAASQSSDDDTNALAGMMMVETTTSILKHDGMVRKGGIQVNNSGTFSSSLSSWVGRVGTGSSVTRKPRLTIYLVAIVSDIKSRRNRTL